MSKSATVTIQECKECKPIYIEKSCFTFKCVFFAFYVSCSNLRISCVNQHKNTATKFSVPTLSSFLPFCWHLEIFTLPHISSTCWYQYLICYAAVKSYVNICQPFPQNQIFSPWHNWISLNFLFTFICAAVMSVNR